MKVVTDSAQETIGFGRIFATLLRERDVIVLTGSLGAGKTTFVQGVLKGFAIKKHALSPTFTLMREYKAKSFNVYHVDLYRIDAGDVSSIGLEDYLYTPKSITLIEWGEKIIDTLPDYIKVSFSFAGPKRRSVTILQKGCPNRKL
jgi:tRNA threonylcarbamoyladenosine biosynthesis protein TsaE